MNKTSGLNDRSLQLLKKLVERYIDDGQPVGSKVLAQESNLSSATIRNVMADLEQQGFIQSPHTSAGRIPTISGYRLFVDNLLTVSTLESDALKRLREGLTADDSIDVISTASRLLADLTQMAGVVTLPRRDLVCLSHIEFLPLSNNRVLVIFVTNEQEVHNKIIHTNKVFSTSELQQAANYLNAIYCGRSLSAIRNAVLKELHDDRERVNQQMLDAIRMAELAFNHAKEDYVLAGETNLMDFSELADREHLKTLFEAFHQKQDVLHLLDHCMKSEGVQIFIGKESGYQAFDHCSLVTSSYSISDEVVGVLGVIGPTRMAYQKIIPFVDVTAKLLSLALNAKMPQTS